VVPRSICSRVASRSRRVIARRAPGAGRGHARWLRRGRESGDGVGALCVPPDVDPAALAADVADPGVDAAAGDAGLDALELAVAGDDDVAGVEAVQRAVLVDPEYGGVKIGGGFAD